jgi:hypothetical protein
MACQVSSPVVDRLAYTRRRLLALRHTPGTKLLPGTNELSAAGLLRYRGRRAGERSRDCVVHVSVYQQTQATQPGVNEIQIVRSFRSSCSKPAERASDRLGTSTMTFGCQRILPSNGRRNAPLTLGLLNIRSIVNKLDDLLEVRRDRLIDVLCLAETWHDADSATFRRLLKDGYQVVNRNGFRYCTKIMHGHIPLELSNDVISTSINQSASTIVSVPFELPVIHLTNAKSSRK